MLTVGAGAIIPIGTGIIGVPVKRNCVNSLSRINPNFKIPAKYKCKKTIFIKIIFLINLPYAATFS